MEAGRELVEAVRERYQSGGRMEKKEILNEFAEISGYHRKHVIRMLGNGYKRSRSPQAGRQVYNEAVTRALTIVWEAADRICGKRLKAVLTTFVESMEHHDIFAWKVECVTITRPECSDDRPPLATGSSRCHARTTGEHRSTHG